MALPQDPFILLSFVNTELRDRFESLEAFCEDHQVERSALVEKLERVGFRYDPAQKSFRVGHVSNKAQRFEEEGKL